MLLVCYGEHVCAVACMWGSEDTLGSLLPPCWGWLFVAAGCSYILQAHVLPLNSLVPRSHLSIGVLRLLMHTSTSGFLENLFLEIESGVCSKSLLPAELAPQQRCPKTSLLLFLETVSLTDPEACHFCSTRWSVGWGLSPTQLVSTLHSSCCVLCLLVITFWHPPLCSKHFEC